MNDFLAPPTLRVLGPRATLALVAAIDPTILPDGSIVFCQENGENYRLDKTSLAALDSPYVLDTASGNGRWILDVFEEVFAGDVEVQLDQNRFSIYSGPAAPVSFTKAATGHLEQRVKTYRFPSGTATSVSFAADLNVNELDAFDTGTDYLVVFSSFSGVVIATARQVTP